MCGFVVAKSNDANHFFIQRRGPDLSRSCEINGFFFTHHLLHITGDSLPQPFVDGGVVCVYNGEIYNHPYKTSDGEVLIPLYRKYGESFINHLDGEFAIALYDFRRQIALFATDPFATKPLWVNGSEAASYRSGIGGSFLPPNTLRILNLQDNTYEERIIRPFDFGHQHKSSFDDWIAAFERAIAKRAYDTCFMGLSSGYDSGAIDCALQKLGVNYKTYSVIGKENSELLKRRNQRGTIMSITREMIEAQLAFLEEFAEAYTYHLTTVDGQVYEHSMLEDKAVFGLASIFTLAKQEGRRVNLSGQGADEIMSDCCRWSEMSELRGTYPTQLRPWRNFYGNLQRAYLGKEEHVAGAFGIETRYPFLDWDVVQEFLWLQADLKNLHYKAPIHDYLTRNNYPFDLDKKIGFYIQ